MATEAKQPIPVYLPKPIHYAARLKALRLGTSVNKVLNAKLVEWLNEPESKQTPTPRVASVRRAKSAA